MQENYYAQVQNYYQNSNYYNQGPAFDVNKDCDDLRSAMKGVGTDEATLINILGNRTIEQRKKIQQVYSERIKRDLIKDLKSELGGKLEDVMVLLFKNAIELDCKYLYDSLHGAGTDEDLLIEILCTRPTWELMQAKQLFPTLYKEDLTKWVKSDTRKLLEKLLVGILEGKRSDNMKPDLNQCSADAQTLYKAGEGKVGTDENAFINIFISRSPAELYQIMNCYQQISKKSLYDAIDSEFSGDIKKALKTILQAMTNTADYFAEKLKQSMKGAGTRDKDLIRLIVTRCDVDMPYIRQAYKFRFGKELIDDIKSDTSGDYRKILITLASK